MELKGTKINFLGDSITEGAGTSSHDKMFTMLIEREYGAICQNYGIGGTRIARQKTPTEEKWDRDFISRVPEMDNDADIVVVFGGTNDFGHGDAPLGTMSDRTPYTFYGALHCLYTALTEKYPDVPVVILTPLHRLNEDSPKGDNKPEPVGTLKEYVNIIREVAEYYSFPVLDLYKESGLQPKVPVIQQKYIPDGLHPNDDGNAILAHKIARFLETL
jgi:lysophospholipase L1-like esterase